MTAKTIRSAGAVALVCATMPGALLAQAAEMGHALARAVEARYQTLLARAQTQDPATDFTALRKAYADRPPWKDTRASELRLQLFPALEKGSYDQALALAAKVLAGNGLDIDAHIVAARAYHEKHDAAQEKLHSFLADGLCRSILASGDGKSVESAYAVIAVEEEHTILRTLGWDIKAQRLVETPGEHFYDRMEVVNPKTQREATIYFNIDMAYAIETKTVPREYD